MAEQDSRTYQTPDGRPKNTGATLHESVVRIRVDDERSRSNYTIHVEHPAHDSGTRCFFRNDREMVVSAIRSHLDKLADSSGHSMRPYEGTIHRADVVDAAGLGLTETELLPESYTRTGPFAPDTPEVEVAADV